VVRFIRTFLSVFALGLALALVGLLIMKSRQLTKHQSTYTYEQVAKINPALIIDKYTLTSPDVFKESVGRMVEFLIKRGAVVPTAFGMEVVTQEASSLVIPIIIQSGGGYVSVGMQLSQMIIPFKQSGSKVHCHVSEAQSMAFYLMVTLCDRVIAKKSVKLMQHRSSYGSKGFTPSTYLTDIEMARGESQALKVSIDSWMELTRGEEDHVFTLEEIERYGLVHEWVQ